MLWKWHMLAMLWDLGLEEYMEKDANTPEATDTANPTQDEKEAEKK